MQNITGTLDIKLQLSLPASSKLSALGVTWYISYVTLRYLHVM
jgi:hypothetical protein